MLNSDHPVDERLAALAAHDPDATHDAALAGHVAACARCAAVVRELAFVQVALAELPDVAPHRPLRLLPPVEDRAAAAVSTAGDPVAHWIRRLFAPALTMGAALAMVGVVGTALPGLGGAQSMPGGALDDEAAAELFMDGTPGATEAAAAAGAAESQERTLEAAEGGGSDAGDPDAVMEDLTGATDAAGGAVTGGGADGGEATPMPAERSPWPMVLFAGLAVMIMAALLRWILVPRAG